jgi:hypothetical protein
LDIPFLSWFKEVKRCLWDPEMRSWMGILYVCFGSWQ